MSWRSLWNSTVDRAREIASSDTAARIRATLTTAADAINLEKLGVENTGKDAAIESSSHDSSV